MAIPLQDSKVTCIYSGATLTASGTTVSAVIDMKDYDSLFVCLQAGSATTSAFPVAIEMQESDDLTTYSAIISAGTAATYTGWVTQVTGITNVTHSLNTQCMTVWATPWGAGRKRYFRVKPTGPASDSCSFIGFAIQSRAAQSPTGTNVGGKYVFPVS